MNGDVTFEACSKCKHELQNYKTALTIQHLVTNSANAGRVVKQPNKHTW